MAHLLSGLKAAFQPFSGLSGQTADFSFDLGFPPEEMAVSAAGLLCREVSSENIVHRPVTASWKIFFFD